MLTLRRNSAAPAFGGTKLSVPTHFPLEMKEIEYVKVHGELQSQQRVQSERMLFKKSAFTKKKYIENYIGTPRHVHSHK